AVTNTDDDTSGITVTPTAGLTTSEAGGTDSFSVVLDSEPTDDVSIGINSSDATEGTPDVATLTFTAGNWDTPQTVTVTGVDDDIDDGDSGYSIITAPAVGADAVYNGLDGADVAVTNTDDDTAGITVTPTSGLTTTEAGGTDSFTVVLDTEPTADVSIGISSSDAGEGTPDVTTLTFTAGNWDTPQTVTVTGADDAVVDGDQGYTIVTAAAVSADAVYSGLNGSDVAVTNSDDDTAGLQIDDVSVVEGTGGNTTATFSVSLDTAVDGGFSVDYSSADASATAPADYVAVSGTLNFVGTLGETQTISVTVIGDGDFEPDETYLINLAAPSNAAVGLTDGSGLGTIVNDDGADLSVTLAATPDPVTAGLTLVYTATVSNDGPANGDVVVVSLTLPAGASFVSGTVSGGGSCAGAGPVLCSFSGPVLPGAANARSAVVNVAIAASQLGTLTGTAVVSAGTADPDPANNSSSVTTAVAAAADLSLALSIDPPAVAVSEFFTLTAVASNNGPSDAVNVRIDIDVPPGALLVGSTPSTGGLCASAPVGGSVQLSCDYAGATAPGMSRSVAVLLQAVAPGQIELSGVVASDTADPQPGNQAAAVTLGAAAVPIPALQPTALLGLLLTLMGLGAGYLRRR
ncbi:MAG: DUF11 domain-containing protein, partial [Xanthomonadales bacterium]|nr:DUF11 domain-containing protein [Xanthomonadales bacterium]